VCVDVREREKWPAGKGQKRGKGRVGLFGDRSTVKPSLACVLPSKRNVRILVPLHGVVLKKLRYWKGLT
jgi:hypothetical protein